MPEPSAASSGDSSPSGPAYGVSNNSGRSNLMSVAGTAGLALMTGGIGIGTFMMYRSTGEPSVLWVMGGMTLILLAVTAWVGVSSARERSRQQQRREALRRDPNRPWTVREDWANGYVDARGNDDVRFELDEVPAVLGGTVSGHITGPDITLGEDQATVRAVLSCEYTHRRDDRANTSWRDEAELPVKRLGPGRFVLPVTFDLPADASPATPDPEGLPRIDWTLRIYDEGWDGAISFRLPVFERVNVAQETTAAGDPAETVEEDSEVAALPSDGELNARFEHVQIDERPEGLRMRFDTPLTQYTNNAGCGWALVVVLLLIHGFLGYVNVSVVAPPPVHIIPHAVVAPFTLYFLYNTLTTGRVCIDVQVERGTFRVQMSGSADSTLLETPRSNVKDIRSKIAAPEHPERGHALRVHCREMVDQGYVQNTMASVGEATDSYGQHTGQLDPRKAPEIPLYLPTKDMADTLAARLRKAVRG